MTEQPVLVGLRSGPLLLSFPSSSHEAVERVGSTRPRRETSVGRRREPSSLALRSAMRARVQDRREVGATREALPARAGLQRDPLRAVLLWNACGHVAFKALEGYGCLAKRDAHRETALGQNPAFHPQHHLEVGKGHTY